MAVAKMRKVTIFAYEEIGESIFETLRDLEILHVIKSESYGHRERGDAEEPEVDEAKYNETLSQLSAIKSYFERYTSIKKSFIDMFTGAKPQMSYEDFQKVVARYDVAETFDKVQSHEKRLREIDKEIEELSQRTQVLEPWVDFDIPISHMGPTKTCDMQLAIVPTRSLSEAVKEIPLEHVHFKVIWQEHGNSGVWLVGLSDEEPSLSAVVSAFGGVIVNLGREVAGYSETGLVSDALANIEKKKEELLNERNAILVEDSEVAQNLMDILALIDYYLDKKNLFEIHQEVAKTRFTLVIEGYARAKEIDKLRNGLGMYKDIEVIDEEPGQGEDIPVLLENNALVRPFEFVTNIYGYPQYNEMDPTPFLAPFFWVFFAMCLGDAIYGIILSIFSIVFLRTQNLEDDKLIKLLGYCGISTVFAGALMGSWLGDLPKTFLAGTAFEKFTSSIAILDPVNDPITLLIVSLGLGILHIWVGIIVKMIGTIRQGAVVDGILSHGSWVVFLPGLILWAVSQMGIIQSSVPLYIMIAGAVGIMWSGARNQKNILMKPISAIGGFYSMLSYFSDTLSYARILALGLASAIIGVVVNMVSALVVDMVPGVGWVFVPVILIVGHLFNLLINALGSFIHSGRLQYVEFFSKFFEGGGTPFRPLKRVRKNVWVVE
ncbi:MAG TPA: V-type ATP synthase subunit I [Bacillota bacterium]|nr:V-type ATP synthase subunit I [Bacillota bacterium]